MPQRPVIRWVALPLLCLGLLLLIAAVSWWFTRTSDAPTVAEAPAHPLEEPSPPNTPVVPPPAFPSPQSAVPVLPGPGEPKARRIVAAVEPVIESYEGDFRPEDVRAAIQAVTPLVQQCFEDAAQRNRGLQSVKLRFNVESRGGGRGQMNRGEVLVSTIPDPMVQACVVDSLLDIDFPTPSRGGRAQVVYPFVFGEPGETGR
ncbi:AgmX/PglI C-terminal domain-containing protein [Myxococcus landrumensis]|uniref:AgmX/PglI C-terminal domain-containing protein n=1 Tax=Myxococcus landrumensis TaxID=2813577 RepID=A0ABX7MWA5_9BACT|nr:AgmX/PglI C-terminal domain-containing protein [Myxococcus landrumus]QSQ10712.1 AgmX/PglI C-terminal domain-containing protein [Myxococcus landrumus]